MSREASLVHRPPFDPAARVVARREVRIGKLYAVGDELPSGTLSEREITVLWRQGIVDTLPAPATAPQPTKRR